MAKKLRTPIIKPRRQGGTFYTFGSAMEDIGLNVNESHNRVEISHYVLLDLPKFSNEEIETNQLYINFNNNKYDGDPYTRDSSSQGDFIFADSFQNYCLNMETVLRNQDRYDYASNKTVSERVFWKWLFSHMKNKGELISDGSYFYEAKEKSIAKGFGSISAGAQRTDDSGLYNETFVQIPSSYGQMRVLFKKSLDENYLDGKEYYGTNSGNEIENISEGEISEGGMIYFYMLNNDFAYPNPNATIQVRGITPTTTYTLTVVKSDKDNYLIQCLLGNTNTNNIPSGNGTIVVNGVTETYNYFLKSESSIDIIRSTGISPYAESDAENGSTTPMYSILEDIDKLEVEFDINKLRKYYSDLSLTYDDIGMGNVDKQSVVDSCYGDYTFNAILVYYSIYDSNKTKRLSTNAYGLYVLDNAINSSDDTLGANSDLFYFPSIYKRMGTNKKNGTSYSFRINVKPSTAYSGDITVNDNSTEAYSMSEDFNDVLRNLTSAVTVMKENAKMLYKISRENEDVKRFASDTMERVNEIKNEVMNIRNGNYPYTASSIFIESGSYTYALPTGLANNIIDNFVITYDADGNMNLDINDSGLNASELAIVDKLRKAMNDRNYIDVISIMMLLITALKNIGTTENTSSGDSSFESIMTPEEIEEYIDGYVNNIVSSVDNLQNNITTLENTINDIADDITLGMTSNHKVAIKEREYIAGTQSQMGQMGYIILKKQQTFKTQIESVITGNTIFEIRYNYDLGGSTVNIPENCILKFEGGSISNGDLVVNSNITITGTPKFYETRLDIAGTENNHVTSVVIENVVFDFAPSTSTRKAPLHLLWCDNIKLSNIAIKNRYSSGYHLYTTDYYSAIGIVNCKNVIIDNLNICDGINGTAFAMYWCKDVYIKNLILDDRKNVTNSSLTTAAEIYFCEDVNINGMFVYSSAVPNWNVIENFDGIYSLVNFACRNLVIEDSYFYGGKCVDLSNELNVAIGGKQPSDYAPTNFNRTTIWSLSDETVRRTTIKSGFGVEFGSHDSCGKITVDNCDIEVLPAHLGNRYLGVRVWNATDITLENNTFHGCGCMLNILECENDVNIKIHNNVAYMGNYNGVFYAIWDFKDGDGKITNTSIINNIVNATNNDMYLIHPVRHDSSSFIFSDNNIECRSLHFNSNRSENVIGCFGSVQFNDNTIIENHTAGYLAYDNYIKFDDYIGDLSVTNNKCYRLAFELTGVNSKQIINNTFSHNKTNSKIVSIIGSRLDNCIIENNFLLNKENGKCDGVLYFRMDEGAYDYNVGADIAIKDNKCKYTYGTPATSVTMKSVWENSNEFSNNVDSTIRTKGPTANRPTRINYTGLKYYDTQIKKEITWDGDNWKESDGATAGVERSGSTRPTGDNIYVGFMFFDTEVGKPLYAKTINGSNVTWVDANGSVVS